jgi:hypothetical protein
MQSYCDNKCGFLILSALIHFEYPSIQKPKVENRPSRFEHRDLRAFMYLAVTQKSLFVGSPSVTMQNSLRKDSIVSGKMLSTGT